MDTVEIKELDANGNVISTKVVNIPKETDAIVVPPQIQMWQARAMLIRMGLLETVNQTIASSNNAEMQNAWEYAPNVVRRSPFVQQISGLLGLSDQEIDSIFIEGEKIK